MSRHVADDRLEAFVAGDLDEDLAVQTALHLDDCSSCAHRAATLEPLAAAFAAVGDPSVPPELVARVMAEVNQPERFPVVEIALGSTLLAAAAAVAILTGDPLWIVVRVGVLLDALSVAASHLPVVAAAPLLSLLLSTFAVGIGTAFATRYASADWRLS